jgi:hypothetical protein
MSLHSVTLTRPESKVLSLMLARLLTVRQTAARLGITEGTLNTYRTVRRASRSGWATCRAVISSRDTPLADMLTMQIGK